jgi:hypothetical protein
VFVLEFEFAPKLDGDCDPKLEVWPAPKLLVPFD